MKKTLVRLLVCTFTVPIFSGAMAQENEAADNAIDEITVISDRREKAIMDVTKSIQAIPEATLTLPTFSEVSDVMNLVPGATSFTNKQPAKEGMQFRGSGIVQGGAADGQSAVGYYVDDVPFVDISTPGLPPIGTFDLQSIEIRRGPQGTTYGQDASAGSIIMRTNPVDLENFGVKARAGVSSVDDVDGNGYEIGGVLNMPLVKDVFGIRLGYLREEDPGYGRIEGQPEVTNPLENTRDSLRIKALWQASENLKLELTHSQWNTKYNTLPGTQILDTTGGEMVLSPVEVPILLDAYPDGLTNDYEVSWTTLLIDYDFSFARFTSSTGFVESPEKEANSEFIFDIGSGPQKSGVISNQPTETVTQEFRLVSTTDSNLQWIAGLYYLHGKSEARTLTETPDFFVYERTFDPIDSKQYAVYGEIDYAITDQWSVQAGLRYNDEDRTTESKYDLGFIGVDDPYGEYSLEGELETVEDSFNYTSYSLGVTWRPSDNGMIYLTHATSNRAPIILTQGDRMALEAAGLPANNLDPAELANTEIGIKWTIADSLQLEAAYVYGDWKDIPLWADVNIPPTPVAMAIPGTDGVITTVELSANWAITDNLSINYAGAFTDSEVKKIPPEGSVEGFPPVIVVGGDLYNYAPSTHNFGINYNRAIGSGDWILFGSANYVTRDKPDGFNVFLDPDGYIPAADKYENLAITLGVGLRAWDFSLSVANATGNDGQYLPRTALGGTDAQLFGLIQPPTTYTFQVTWDGMR